MLGKFTIYQSPQMGINMSHLLISSKKYLKSDYEGLFLLKLRVGDKTSVGEPVLSPSLRLRSGKASSLRAGYVEGGIEAKGCWLVLVVPLSVVEMF